LERDRLRLTRHTTLHEESEGKDNVFLGLDGKMFEFTDLDYKVTVVESHSKTDIGLQPLVDWLDQHESVLEKDLMTDYTSSLSYKWSIIIII
jgi:hypothetical protein